MSPVFDNADYLYEMQEYDENNYQKEYYDEMNRQNNFQIRMEVYNEANKQSHIITPKELTFVHKEYGGSITWIAQHFDEVMIAGLRVTAPIEVLAALEIVPPDKENLLE
jgi:hypothetical protein